MKYVGNNVGIHVGSETKIYDTFPKQQFLIEDFSTPYRLDRTATGRGRGLLQNRGYTLPQKKSQRTNDVREFL